MSKLFPSIANLIPELKLGDEKAWAQLCDSFRPGLISRTRFFFNSAERTKKPNPEDVVQDTFLRAWNYRESFRGVTTSQFAKWILTILRNQCIDSLRDVPAEATLATWFEFKDKNATPASNLISIEQEASLHACVADMNPDLRQVIVLRHFEGLKFAEIAEQTDTNINTVAGLYRRGLAKLTYALQDLQSFEGQ